MSPIALPGGRYRTIEKMSGDYWQVCGVNRGIVLRDDAGRDFFGIDSKPSRENWRDGHRHVRNGFHGSEIAPDRPTPEVETASLLIPVPRHGPSKRRPFMFHQKLLFVFHNVPIPS